jgi:hypothetical protein
MVLTKDYLLELKTNAAAKRQEFVTMIQQANGAIEMIDFLLKQLEQSESEQKNDDAV